MSAMEGLKPQVTKNITGAHAPMKRPMVSFAPRLSSTPMVTSTLHKKPMKNAFWNGMVILVSTLLQPVSDKVVAALHIERKSAWYQVFSMLRTFVVVLIGYYFDIADGFRAAMGMMLKSVTDLHLSQLRPGAVLEALPLTRYDWAVLLFGTVVIFTASVIQERSQRTIREILDEKCLALRWAVLLAGIFAVVLMGVYGPGVQASEFVYMQF